jgi:hypothetical protein
MVGQEPPDNKPRQTFEICSSENDSPSPGEPTLSGVGGNDAITKVRCPSQTRRATE